ncbi:MAG: SocA family protein [Candidatus Omnitrophica bacterium]|nr:SocA family protein [Candidatus Omnitrophota bacterium]
MNSKTKELLAYLIEHHTKASVTVLMKLSYLIDLVSTKRGKGQISDFTYKRYFYGPFDEHIYQALASLVEENLVQGQPAYSPDGQEFITYSRVGEESPLPLQHLDDQDIEIINDVLTQVQGYGAKALTDIAYKTVPMKKLGATQGGYENLNAQLNLNSD